MNRNISFLTGFALGAVCMYLFDPAGGRRRRALIRDQFTHFAHKTGDRLDAVSRDWSNRAAGTVAEARRAFGFERPGQESDMESEGAPVSPQW